MRASRADGKAASLRRGVAAVGFGCFGRQTGLGLPGLRVKRTGLGVVEYWPAASSSSASERPPAPPRERERSVSRKANEVRVAPGVISWHRMSSAMARIGALLLFVSAMLLWAGVGYSGDRVARLSRLLAASKDFRVRMQAALALGASKSKAAVDPLCRGLGDSSTSVRAASAAALGKLRKGGSGCLKKRLSVESSGTVKSVINKALARIAAGGAAAPKITPATKYYLAVDVMDKTGRTDGSVTRLVRRGMGKAAAKLAAFAISPAGETKSQAEKLLARAGIRVILGAPAARPQELVAAYLAGELTSGTNTCTRGADRHCEH